jgi:hypothetical protein
MVRAAIDVLSQGSPGRQSEDGAKGVLCCLKTSWVLADRFDVPKCSLNVRSSLAAILDCLALAAPAKAQEYSSRYCGAEDGHQPGGESPPSTSRSGGRSVGGTENGLFRYDGRQFQRHGPAEGLPHEVVLSLGQAPDGTLLAGYRGR